MTEAENDGINNALLIGIEAEFNKCTDMEAVLEKLAELNKIIHERAVERHNWVFREYFLW